MEPNFYRGNFRKDGVSGSKRGWLVGTFMEAGPRRTNDVEIKYGEYPKGPVDHDRKTSAIIEATFILKGATKAEIDGQEFVLSAGDYVVIQPNIPNNTVTDILEDVVGLTIKAPSDPKAKKVISSSG